MFILQSSVGNLYEAGQPVLLRLLEVLNEGLCLLHEERKKIAGTTKHLHHQDLQEQALLFSRSKENLKIIRYKCDSKPIHNYLMFSVIILDGIPKCNK